ncbi:MAG TPA: acetate kinase [Methylococcaceae bacterium]|nr:acetate kinase [Methylococcaceae bacterium]
MNASPRVLVINCGSSSLKYRLLDMDGERTLAGGLLERIGESRSRLLARFRDEHGELAENSHEVTARDHREAFRHVQAALADYGRPDAVGHRVVHGGETFSAPTRLDSAAIEAIREMSSLAPLHNPANLTGIELCRAAFPDIPQVAVFDTAFHHTLPPHAFRYAVPEDWYLRHGVRRYGFHGTSHRYLAERAAQWLERPLAQSNLITLHLGNGASAAAIEKGRCVDTSMGFTPLEGLVMGTRCGDLDAAVPLHMQHAGGLSAAEVEHALNHESGLKGLCGVNDVREILAREQAGDDRARLAMDMYCYRARKYIGAYSAVLGEVDALVFSGGVGANAAMVRARICTGLERLGIALDAEQNRTACGEAQEIGQAGRPVGVLVIPTDEELQIARETLAVAFAP